MAIRPPALRPQLPLPFPAALDYEAQVLQWAVDAGGKHLLHAGLRYGGAPEQAMDVFAPAGARSAPVLVVWHGGGWTNGYREYGHFMAQRACALGFVLVLPGYRLAPEHRLPAAYDDAESALDFVRAHAAQWGGDPGRIVLSGHSAGGGVAAMCALRRGAAGQQGLAACMPLSGIFDIRHADPVPGTLEARVYEMLLARPEDDWAMSAAAYLDNATVPFILCYGDKDSERVRQGNRAFAREAQARGLPAELHCWEDTDHFQTHLRLADAAHPWWGMLARAAG